MEDTIKEALAAGGDEACLIIDEPAEADSSMIAQVLAAGIKQLDNVDLILLVKVVETIIPVK